MKLQEEGSKRLALVAQCALPERKIRGKCVLLAHATRLSRKRHFSLASSTRRLVIFLYVEPYGPAPVGAAARSSRG